MSRTDTQRRALREIERHGRAYVRWGRSGHGFEHRTLQSLVDEGVLAWEPPYRRLNGPEAATTPAQAQAMRDHLHTLAAREDQLREWGMAPWTALPGVVVHTACGSLVVADLAADHMRVLHS